jgi:hypothetical protein
VSKRGWERKTRLVRPWREVGGRFNASTMRIDGPGAFKQLLGTGDREWIIFGDDGEAGLHSALFASLYGIAWLDSTTS